MLVYWIWLAELPHASTAQKCQLLQHFSDPEEIYFSEEKAFQTVEGITEKTREALENKNLEAAHTILQECVDKGIGILTLADAKYPEKLKNIYDPPVVLYYKGKLPDWERMPTIGVVGTRKATPYGLQTAMRLSNQIAGCGGLIVSGGAFGGDTMAMQGALRAEKPVVGVLGCGVDVVYPKSNRNLFDQVVENGCLLSEYPPKTPPNGWHFPIRNRIISGISNGVLVVEAPESSGALITARSAWEQGRDVFAVPGNIDVPACVGSNSLLQQGAIAVLSGWDVLKEYEASYPGVVKKQDVPVLVQENPEQKVAQKAVRPKILEPFPAPDTKKFIDNGELSTYSGLGKKGSALSPEEQAVAALLTQQPQLMDDILAVSDMPAGTVLSILTKLTLKGVVKNHPGRRVSLK